MEKSQLVESPLVREPIDRCRYHTAPAVLASPSSQTIKAHPPAGALKQKATKKTENCHYPGNQYIDLGDTTINL